MGQPSVAIFVDYKGTPHTFIKLDNGDGDSQYYGFAPKIPGSPFAAGSVGEGVSTHALGDPSNSTAGYMDDVVWSKEIPISLAQLDAMNGAVTAWRATGHSYNVTGLISGENCTTFAKAILAAGGVSYPGLAAGVNPLSLIPNSEQGSLFTVGPDGRKSLSDAVRDPLNTPGTPAYEYRQTHPEMFMPSPGTAGTEDQSTSELRMNNDGSFSEEILEAGASTGDRTSIDYDVSGEVTKVTEVDGAGNNADYIKRTTRYDAEGRVDWINKVRDDGSTDWTDYDQTGAASAQRWESHTDAQGRTDWVRTTKDDGSTDWTDYDQTGAASAARWESHTDAQGRTDWVRTTKDDGSTDWLDYDQAGVDSAARWESHTDARGRTDWIRTTADDGSIDWLDYDQTGVDGAARWESHTDAQGRTDWIRTTADDGSTDWLDYDQAGVDGAARWESHTDAQGRTDWIDVLADDGSSTRTDFDQTGTEYWSRVDMSFDASGSRNHTTLHRDDGARVEYDYFPDVHPEAYASHYIYADGHGAGGRVLFDGSSHMLEIGGGNFLEWPDSTMDMTIPNFIRDTGYALEPYY